MLIINRRSGEKIVLAEHITVSVLSIAGNRVKIGITAPGNVHIVREELLQREQAQASQTACGNDTPAPERPVPSW